MDRNKALIELNSDLDEAVRNLEITEQEAEVEYKATIERWNREEKMLGSVE